MANLTLRTLTNAGDTTKGTPLTNTEMDQNLINLNNDIGSRAPIDSPALTGVPTAPTAAAATNTTQIATTAHVFAERSNTATLTNKTLTSPALTGTPTTPTAALNTNTTQVAQTAFVVQQVATVDPIPMAIALG